MDIFSSSNANLGKGRPNLNDLGRNASNNVPVPASENSTTTPALTSINKTNNSLTNRSNVTGIGKVESSSVSKKVVIDDFEISDSEPTLISRSKSNEEKNDNAASEELSVPASSSSESNQEKNDGAVSEQLSVPSFGVLQKDIFGKILFENLIILEDISETAKNLMHIASISKNHHEFVRVLLMKENYQKVSFEITKSAIQYLLSKQITDENAKFTDTDINHLVHVWPFLTVELSYREGKTFTNWGVDIINKLVLHPELRGLRIVNNLPDVLFELNENYDVCSINGLKLLRSLLAREHSSRLTVDFNYENWVPPLAEKTDIDEETFNLLKEIQASANTCTSVIFGEINLSLNRKFLENYSLIMKALSVEMKDFQFKFVEMMCHVGLSHSAHTISLSGLYLSDEQVKSVLDKILACEKSSLKHLDLSFNKIYTSAATSLGNLLISNNTCLETLKLDVGLSLSDFEIVYEGLKANTNLKSVLISTTRSLSDDHPIRSDARVTLKYYF